MEKKIELLMDSAKQKIVSQSGISFWFVTALVVKFVEKKKNRIVWISIKYQMLVIFGERRARVGFAQE